MRDFLIRERTSFSAEVSLPDPRLFLWCELSRRCIRMPRSLLSKSVTPAGTGGPRGCLRLFYLSLRWSSRHIAPLRPYRYPSVDRRQRPPCSAEDDSAVPGGSLTFRFLDSLERGLALMHGTVLRSPPRFFPPAFEGVSKQFSDSEDVKKN